MLLPALASGQDLARYRVTVDADLAHARIEVMAGATGAIPPLVARSRAAIGSLDPGSLEGAAVADARIVARGSALSFRVALRPEAGRHALRRAEGMAPLALTDPREWLWLPADWPTAATVALRFELPAGVSAATPWRRRVDGAFELHPQLLDEPGLIGFGAFDQHELARRGAIYRISIARGAPDDPQADARLLGWATRVVDAAAGAVGAPARAVLQIVMVPSATGDDPAPWGEMRRGTGNSLLAIVSRTASDAARLDDWTLFHEIAHSFPPYLGDDRWLSEGIASYYQNVLRAESGVIPPQRAWQRLSEGFARGAAAARPDATVEEGGRMVTYWEGAVLALEWDLALRRASGGRVTLDDALTRFGARHLPTYETWTAERFAAALDHEMATDSFSRSLRSYLGAKGFPDYRRILRDAGVDPDTGATDPTRPAAYAGLMQPRR